MRFPWFFLLASACLAQDLCPQYDTILQKIKDAGANTAARDKWIRELVPVNRYPECFLDLAAPNAVAFKDWIRRFENFRADKQPGATSAGEGTTTLVSRGAIPRAMAFAVENGALAQSISGTVVTFRGNLGGIPELLVRKDIFPYCGLWNGSGATCISNRALDYLRRIGFGVSFDASRGQDTVTATSTAAGSGSTSSGTAVPAVFTANRRQISGLTARWDIVHSRDFGSTAKWRGRIEKSQDIRKAAQAAVTEVGAFAEQFTLLDDYLRWETAAREALQRTSTHEGLLAAFKKALSEAAALLQRQSPELQRQAEKARDAARLYRFELEKVLDEESKKPLVSIEYVHQRPLNQTPLHNFRGIIDLSFDNKWTLAANGAVTVFDCMPQAPPGALRRVRDVQLGIQADRPLGEIALLGPTTFSLAGYYQHQASPAILKVDPKNPLPGVNILFPPGVNPTAVFAEKGDILIAQAKLLLGRKDSGVKVPFSLSYANRTELIRKPEWRLNVGLTWDLDALFMRP